MKSRRYYACGESGQMKRVICFVLYFSFLLPAFASDETSPHAVENALNCEYVSAAAPLSYDCTLDPNKNFLGIRLGMDYKQAFLKLLENTKSSTWTSYDSIVVPRTFSPNKGGIELSDWAVFKGADRWLLRDQGAPCVGPRYLFLHIVKRRVDSFFVQCTKSKP